jgi:cbb3-type cytochrome oxidase subunit 3
VDLDDWEVVRRSVPMTWLLVAALMWIGLAVLAWALCAARRPSFAQSQAAPPPEAERPRARPRSVVADVAAVRRRLRAALVLLDARRLELLVPGPEGETVLACAGEPDAAAGAVATRVPVCREAETVAWLHVVRPAAAPPLGEADERMLGALGASLGDSLGVARDPERSGRFRRDGDGHVRTPGGS